MRSWYEQAYPDMGYTAEERWFGVLRGNTGFDFTSVTVKSLCPDQAGGEPGSAIATVDTEPAGIVAWYGGDDSMIFLVATRLPFRGRGVASASIRRVLEERYASGCRSVLINGDADGYPVQIYRGLGFTDEVYREHRYTRPQRS